MWYIYFRKIYKLFLILFVFIFIFIVLSHTKDFTFEFESKHDLFMISKLLIKLDKNFWNWKIMKIFTYIFLHHLYDGNLTFNIWSIYYLSLVWHFYFPTGSWLDISSLLRLLSWTKITRCIVITKKLLWPWIKFEWEIGMEIGV